MSILIVDDSKWGFIANDVLSQQYDSTYIPNFDKAIRIARQRNFDYIILGFPKINSTILKEIAHFTSIANTRIIVFATKMELQDYRELNRLRLAYFDIKPAKHKIIETISEMIATIQQNEQSVLNPFGQALPW